ncbi:hypothetical protein WPS_23720 [Vulcanimicrobium alpinum]|uniref:tRNA(Ile)-lysidine synthase n=1 Tax=Vulcanimicrobium alpinum TaxID=3016050 RepID=A0AAN1XXA6_UNVUL|nr:tRNA lysidine(34) synthetase TilS [Vulcanimicrobium alpinum]BDE07096.1 hypothetical protein WPS_23720 [Vulcanimicrobium alpinum]
MRGARPERALDAIVRRVLGTDARRGVCVAISGGPDSVALASLVDRLVREAGGDAVFAFVDHGTRAGALQDECVVQSIGTRLGRRVRVARLQASRDDEATLRALRYDALGRIAAAEGCAAVVTAHTAEDQTETVLLALFRGAGFAGLAGIAERRAFGDGIALVRPLLRVARDELQVELRHSGLPYALDPTNDDLRYRRNALRAHLAALRRDFPRLDRAVARYAAIARAEIAATPTGERRRALRARLAAADARDVSLALIDAVLEREGDPGPP